MYHFSERGVVCVSLSLSVLFTTTSPAKMAEPVKMPFGLWTLPSPKERCIRWGLVQIPLQWEGPLFRTILVSS